MMRRETTNSAPPVVTDAPHFKETPLSKIARRKFIQLSAVAAAGEAGLWLVAEARHRDALPRAMVVETHGHMHDDGRDRALLLRLLSARQILN